MSGAGVSQCTTSWPWQYKYIGVSQHRQFLVLWLIHKPLLASTDTEVMIQLISICQHMKHRASDISSTLCPCLASKIVSLILMSKVQETLYCFVSSHGHCQHKILLSYNLQFIPDMQTDSYSCLLCNIVSGLSSYHTFYINDSILSWSSMWRLVGLCGWGWSHSTQCLETVKKMDF